MSLLHNNRIIEQIFRHPIKSIGSELIENINLFAGSTMSGDRVWALVHDKTRLPSTKKKWLPCSSFLRGSIIPSFMAITSKYDDEIGSLELKHPNLEDFTFNPEKKEEVHAFIDWIKPLCPAQSPQPIELYKVKDRGLTDTEYPSISLLSVQSLMELSGKIECALDPRRFRGNLWFGGGKPFEEFDWIDREIIIGSVRLKIIEPIERCNATKVNPLTGDKDLDTLATLQSHYGHKNFGVYCEILEDGKIEKGNKLIFC